MIKEAEARLKGAEQRLERDDDSRTADYDKRRRVKNESSESNAN